MARITVPLDASGIEGFDPKQPVKVLVASGGKPLASQVANLDAKGKAQVAIDFKGSARGVRVVVGPPDASDDELLGLQTIAVDVPLRRWLGKDELVAPAVRITPYYWFWWLRWCRTFTIRGRLLCPDGSPVPGAVVCAYDVDAWWWWWSRQQVGCATTDASGAFTIKFRWCCGWWPWWWWRLRRWQVEPTLAGHLLEALQREPRIKRLPLPEPQPDLAVFEKLLGDRPGDLPMSRAAVKAAGRVEPGLLGRLASRIVDRLPIVPALQALRLWPWWPWQPWWDCTPDIVFRATQTCGGQEHVVVNEGWFSARWNVPQVLDVTLTASDDACCIGTNDCLEGECLALAKACQVDADDIGGNPGADPTPVGLAHPNAIATNGDAPFAGVVEIHGTVQCLSGVDYYEIESTADSGASWQVVPPEALGTIVRQYWDFVVSADQYVPFSAAVPIDGHHVYETIEHYEATHTSSDWITRTKAWLATNYDVVVPWVTSPAFADGTYGLRVVGYDEAGGVLSNPRVLPVCESGLPAQIVVTIDNQSSFPAPGPADNPCGPGTTHTCTNEPSTDILDARIVRAGGGTVTIGACGNVTIAAGDVLEVDFVAYDAQGYLAYYTLDATYGENLSRDLIALAGAAGLGSLPGGAPGVPAASQVGPDYATARTLPQTAVAPVWTGGALRLRVDASLAFPESCCYQLELRAYKRTIVNCHENYAHRNLSERSFQVTV